MSKGSHRRRAERAGGAVRSTSFSHPSDQHEARSAGHRYARLEHIVREELAALLRDELNDPALAGVAFSSVELSVDYRSVRVRFAIARAPDEAPVEPARIARVEQALARAAPFLRAHLGEALEIKRVPSLRFVYDRDAEFGAAPPVDTPDAPDAPDASLADEHGGAPWRE